MEIYNIVFSNFKELESFINENIPKDKNVFLQVFSGYISEEFSKQIISFINKYENIKLIGTTTAGEIVENAVIENRTLFSFSVFEKSSVRIVNIEKDEFEAGKELVSFIKDDTKLIIVFSNGLEFNASDFIGGYFRNGGNVLLVGGLAGDNSNFIHTYVFSNLGIVEKGVVAALIDGEIYPNIIKSFGWKKVGKKFNVTKSEKNVVYELDGENVIKHLKRYLGEEYVEMLPNSSTELPFCCGFNENNLRIVTKKDRFSITLNAGIPNGSDLQIAVPDTNYFASIIKSIQDLVSKISIEGVFIYGNITKKVALKDEFEKELSFISSQTNVSGFFGYGEFGFEIFDYQKCNFESGGVVCLFLSEENSYHKIFKNFKVRTDYKYLTKRPNLFLKESFGHFLNTITEELMEANEKLRKRIEEVVEENIRKNLIIQQQSKQAQLGEMVSMIAHQWKQPLNVVSLYIENMLLGLKMFDKVDKEECIKACENIKKEIKRMNEIINNFATFAKPETKPKEFLIKDALHKALELVYAQFKSRGIEIEVDCDFDTKMIGYETLLEQVFINILLNSRDAFEENHIQNPKIKIECKHTNGYVEIIFEDNGGGIPLDILEKIFNPYFTTKGPKGTGLGLYMSKKIMNEKCDGDIKVETKDDITRFIVLIGPKVLV